MRLEMKLSDAQLATVPELKELSHTLRCALVKELQLRRRLEGYGIPQHKITCDHYQEPFEAECNCGLVELKKELEAL